MIPTLERSAGALLDEATRRGAQEAQVVARHVDTLRIQYEKNDFHVSTAKTERTLDLKVHRDHRLGTASTNETGAEDLAQTAARALTLASFSVPDECLCLPEGGPGPELAGRFDERLAGLPPRDLHAFARAYVEAAREDERITLDAGAVSVETTHEVIANSRGLRVRDRSTRLRWVLMGMAKTASEVTSFDVHSGSSWGWEGSEERSRASARFLADRLVACLGARKGRAYRGKVVLSPAVAADLVLRPLAFQVSGRQIMDGKSHWAESLGERVASEGLDLLDDPCDLELRGATPHDAEGVPARRAQILEKGVLRLHTDSTYTARRRGTTSTGHAGGLHGPVIAPGEERREALLGGGGPVVLVERFSGNVDPVSGDFSGVAKGSHWYEHGEHRHPLAETMIAGNFFEMLRGVVGVSSASEPWCNEHRAPWLLVDGVSVTTG